MTCTTCVWCPQATSESLAMEPKVEHAGQIHVCQANAGGMLNLLNIGVAWMLE
jgi:hypothetical protein